MTSRKLEAKEKGNKEIMELSSMKKWFICLTLISMILLMHVNGNDDMDEYGDDDTDVYLDPCKGPNPAVGCRQDPKTPPQAANPWSRGCSPISECRGGGPGKPEW